MTFTEIPLCSPTSKATVQFEDTAIGYEIRTTSVRTRSSESDALIHATHELLVVDSAWRDVTLATMTSCTVRVDQLERGLLVTLDDEHVDLGVVALAIEENADLLDDISNDDALEREVFTDNFVVFGNLHTPDEHRGNGFGFTLLTEVLADALETMRFAVWIACATEEPAATREAHSDSLSGVYQTKFDAKVLTQRVLIATHPL